MTSVTLCQLALHMSPHLLVKLMKTESQTQRNKQLFDWIKSLSLSLITKGMTSDAKHFSDVEWKLKVIFLSHIRIRDLNKALEFIADSVDLNID